MARLAYGDREFSEDTIEAEPGDSGTDPGPGPGDTGERSPGSLGAGGSQVGGPESSVPSNTIRILNRTTLLRVTTIEYEVTNIFLVLTTIL